MAPPPTCSRPGRYCSPASACCSASRAPRRWPCSPAPGAHPVSARRAWSSWPRCCSVRGLHGRCPRRDPGAGRRRRRRRARPRDLPAYTVLVPVYQEANVVADLIDNLGALDYPREKLEIFLLMEENDSETIEAARGRAPAVDDHVPDRAAGPPADQAQGVQRGPVLRSRRVPGDLRRRGQARTRPAEEGGDRVPARWRPARVRAGGAELLERLRTTGSPGCSPWSTRSGSTTCSPGSTGCACRSRSAARRTTSGPAACACSAAGTRSTSPRTPTSASAPPCWAAPSG